MELADQIALITGGSAGIGLARARLLACEGTTRTWAAEFGARGFGSTASPPAPPKPKASRRSGAEPMRSSAVYCRWATAEPEEIAHAVLFLAAPAQASSRAPLCTPTAAAPPSETPNQGGMTDVEEI
jgi:NAD(P)-dependent dehydrogenase (short-subunit alcohol dehydrogenase family)